MENYAGEELLSASQALVYDQIAEVRSFDGEVMVRMASGEEVPAGLVSGLRQPQ